ncbi:MAG: alpha-L-rhamnosidase C-terminal domain-containing protein [Bacteroidota bacterium]
MTFRSIIRQLLFLFFLLLSLPYAGMTQTQNHLATSCNRFQSYLVAPVSINRVNENHYFIDFGKDAFGTLLLSASLKPSDTIIVHLGEKTINPTTIDRDPGGTIRYQKVKLSGLPQKTNYTILLKPDQRNTSSRAVVLPDSFGTVMPFRYCELENLTIPMDEIAVRQKVYTYHFNDTASAFTSSDTILNQVWELCKYSIKATSFAGVYIDGDRERIPYEADAYINQLSHYSVDNEYSMARKTIEYLMEYPTWPTEWQLHMALMIYQDYMYTGNMELIRNYYEPLKHKTLMALAGDDGLITTFSPLHNGELMANLGFADTTQRLKDIVDWPPAQKDTNWKLATREGERDGFVFRPVNTVVNSFYYQNMKIMALFAGLMNRPEEVRDFRLRAEQTKESINKKLYNRAGGYYTDGIGTGHGSVHANMLPLAFDIVPDAYKKGVADYIKTRGMACSVYGAQYLMEALYRAGEADYALELMTATHDRSWYNMIKVGSTISLEAWDMKYKSNADWNHAWGAAPANIIPRGLWGIQPETPGFGLVSIKPQMGSLKNSSIVMPTIRGEIQCEYRRVNNRLQQYVIKLPEGMAGAFYMDLAAQDLLMLNGETMSLTSGSFAISPGNSTIEIRR